MKRKFAGRKYDETKRVCITTIKNVHMNVDEFSDRLYTLVQKEGYRIQVFDKIKNLSMFYIDKLDSLNTLMFDSESNMVDYSFCDETVTKFIDDLSKSPKIVTKRKVNVDEDGCPINTHRRMKKKEVYFSVLQGDIYEDYIKNNSDISEVRQFKNSISFLYKDDEIRILIMKTKCSTCFKIYDTSINKIKKIFNISDYTTIKRYKE